MGKVVFLVLASTVLVPALTHWVRAAEPESKAPSTERIRQLIRQLDDDDFEVREQATQELTGIGPAAGPALRSALGAAKSLEVRCRLERVLEKIKNSLPYLRDCLHDTDPKVRKESAQRLAELGDKAKPALPALVELLKDKDEDVREAAALAVFGLEPGNKAISDSRVVKAAVGGKYGRLLRRIHVPKDKDGYTAFSDFGHFQATSYAGYDDIPEGYWVYVFPDWYIWGEQKK